MTSTHRIRVIAFLGGTLLVLPSLATAAPPASGEDTPPVEEAKQTFRDQLTPLRIASAKISREALQRCAKIGRVEGLIGVTEEEITAHREELARLEDRSTMAAIRRAKACRARVKRLEANRKDLAAKLEQLRDEHVSKLLAESRTEKAPYDTTRYEAIGKHVRRFLDDRDVTQSRSADAAPTRRFVPRSCRRR